MITGASTINGVSFIIPTWNKQDLIIKCLQLLHQELSKECQEIPTEVIVIDNGSTDDSYFLMKSFFQKNKLPNLRSKIYHLKSNLGFAKAVNLAAKQAKYNYLYLLNNDMEVQPGFFREIINTARKLLQKNIIFFGIASQIFFYDPSIERLESGKTWTDFKNGKLLVGHELNPQKLQNISLTAYCGGGSSLINKEIFGLLGGLDAAVYTPMYGEDLDLGFVAWKKGYPSFFCPKSQVIHHHRSSSKLLAVSPDYYIHKNFLSFCLKNFDNWSLLFKIFLYYPLYLIFKKDYWKYLTDNLKNLSNIISSKNRLKKIPNIFKDTNLIKFKKFELQNGNKYQI